ncbi:hypothetical protein KUTeg_017457 [Tegillarca granosa]|uniref:CUB domain-containing protein n=1 Tax=Tegillarca granosa TaxID=220873 RepID=A0ABQ9EEX7_TEGGR|nr:hypothetical protein KUTeg_017457 [Tegillarca granosa]
MFLLYPALLVLGHIQLLQSSVISCPFKKSGGTETIRFCSNSEVTSSNIYIDSSEVSTRVTNCTCKFNVTVDTHVIINSTLSIFYDCRTAIRFGDENSQLFDLCGNIYLEVGMIQSQTYSLVLINGLVNLKTYCLHLFTGSYNTEIRLKCISDFNLGSTTTTSTAVYTELSAEPSTEASDTTQTTLLYTVMESRGEQLYGIFAPVLGGVLVVIAIIIFALIVYKRRKRGNNDGKSGPRIDPHGYMNRTVDENYENDAEIRANDMYHSINSDPQNDFAEGYAEIQSMYDILQNTSLNVQDGYAILQSQTWNDSLPTNLILNQRDQSIFSLSSNNHLAHDGVVYNMCVKKPKKKQETNNDEIVYEIPDRQKENQTK